MKKKNSFLRASATIVALLLLLVTLVSYFVAPVLADARIRKELGDPDAFVTDTARTPWLYVDEAGVLMLTPENCVNLKVLRIPESINGIAVKNMNSLWRKPIASVKRLILPSNIKTPVLQVSLSDWVGLEEIVFREGCRNIANTTIEANEGLTAIYLPKTLAIIGPTFLAKGEGDPVLYYAGTEKEWRSLGPQGKRLSERYTVVFERSVPEEWIRETK